MSSPSTPATRDATSAGGSSARRWWRDPRAVVVVATLGALGVAGLTSWAITSAIDQSSRSVERLSAAVEPPMAHLLRTERMNAEGQQALYGAVATTGADRTRQLSASIVASQEAAAAWTEYRTSALQLPGERELAARYEAAQRDVQERTSELLVPILNSTVPGTLPTTQIELHQAAERSLRDLYELYAEAEGTELGQLGAHIDDDERSTAVGTAAALAIILLAAAIGMRRARRVHGERQLLREEQRLVAFDSRLRRALELTDSEPATFRLAERGMAEIAPHARVSVLVSDASRASLTPVDEQPACGVTSPSDCPALRSTSVVTVAHSDDLDACPMLTEHSEHPCSATCVPVTITGRAGGLIQIAGAPGRPPDGVRAAALVSRAVGERATLIEALATFQLQAARDPLTGLLNRRSLAAATDGLIDRGDPYAVAYCDLDHFKELNDLHGHDAGDRALRSFARTLTDSLRPQDIVCRWGGEEFVVVLPDCDAAAAAEAMDRVRTNLMLSSMSDQTAAFTASFGVAVSGEGSTFDDVVGRADTALRNAKETGRDRVVRFDSLAEPVSDRSSPTS